MTASLSDILSGLFGLRHREHLNLIMGFTAGVLVGLVSFDLLPEIFRLVYLICALPLVIDGELLSPGQRATRRHTSDRETPAWDWRGLTSDASPGEGQCLSPAVSIANKANHQASSNAIELDERLVEVLPRERHVSAAVTDSAWRVPAPVVDILPPLRFPKASGIV